jgi:hypothetical protein
MCSAKCVSTPGDTSWRGKESGSSFALHTIRTHSSIPIGAKLEISPKGFTLGLKAEIKKKHFNLPQVINKC